MAAASGHSRRQACRGHAVVSPSAPVCQRLSCCGIRRPALGVQCTRHGWISPYVAVKAGAILQRYPYTLYVLLPGTPAFRQANAAGVVMAEGWTGTWSCSRHEPHDLPAENGFRASGVTPIGLGYIETRSYFGSRHASRASTSLTIRTARHTSSWRWQTGLTPRRIAFG